MQDAHITASDGCKLAFQTSLPSPISAPQASCCVLLLHGFSGSSAYFTRNVSFISSKYWVVAPDMRGHGASGRTRGGYHVARLAADLRQIVMHLQSISRPDLKIVPVGCSIGAAVLWTYLELFGCDDFAGFVFVDQAPLQDRSPFENWDSTRAHKGCYDEATMKSAQESWIHDSVAAHRDLAESSLGYLYAPSAGDAVSEEQKEEDMRFFTGISALCDQEWLAKLMCDHTRYDHREAVEMIDRPTLVLYGKRSGCFTYEGVAETAVRVNRKCQGQKLASVISFDSGHWLFYEEPERFNREIVQFVDACLASV
ncbi:Alpha/Beta hydrolase protein [Xylaria bambusicola]|uniref:Alpha/Beta hydrolase protein n=1 Tax=Xylaria bambusicola TaxID=326684 RepID=UPI0020077E5C|nr:Alpha/Beta hydrolase protein [Xylaria bambusicola]KAI0514689.1 Alpha/Beta hydrolase protein [Xylaria bambusicola]